MSTTSLQFVSRYIRSSSHNKFLKNSSTAILASYLHGSSIAQTIYPLRMPALSPTMEHGQISRWNVKTGDQFSAGDVLLTVETDKAEVDVEAQDDGYMGPQLFGPGTDATSKTVNVGELIAVLGEQSEDVQGTLNLPAEWNSKSSSSSTENKHPGTSQETTSNSTASSHTSRTVVEAHLLKTGLPLSPAVSRLLSVSGIEDARKIKGTGLHGRLTKGDVLTHLKQASSPNGTAQSMIEADATARLAERSQLGLSPASTGIKLEEPPLDGLALRQFITEGLSHLSNRPTAITSTDLSFDSILQDYKSSSLIDQVQKPGNNSSLIVSSFHDKYFDGLDQL